MGQEIFYCTVCQKQIRSSDLESGKAFKLENRNFCLTCGPEMLRTLPKDRVKDIWKDITTPARHTPVPATPSPHGRSPSTARRVRPARRSGTWIFAAGAAGIVLGAVGFWVALGNRPQPHPPTSGDPGTGPPVKAAVSAERPAPAAPPKTVPPPQDPLPPPAGKDGAAAEALRKAREWALANPSDFDGALRKFQDACFLATGTPSAADATRELDLYRRKQRDFFAAELLKLEPEVKAACAEERFMKAIDILGLAKERHPSAEWQLIVGKRSREINDAAFLLLDRVKEEALEARKRGDPERVNALRTRVASWGIAQFIKEFREAVDQ
jgi:hypothetical protein